MSISSVQSVPVARTPGAFSRAASKFGAAAWSRSPLGVITELASALHAEADAVLFASTANAVDYVHAADRPATDRVRFL
jgi:hypothetical protein